MPLELASILVLVAVFLVATLLPVNMGALAFVAVFAFGGLVVGEEVPDEVLADFPADLFIILVGVTYLFAIAKNNGTVDWLVQAAVRTGRRPGRADPVGDVRRHLDPHRVRRRRPRGGRDHRPGRPVLRAAARDQPGADEPSDHQRRQRGRLLADQHLRRDHERGGVAQRAAGLPARAVRLVLRDQRAAQRGGLLPLRGPGSAAPPDRHRCRGGGAGRVRRRTTTISTTRCCARSAGGSPGPAGTSPPRRRSRRASGPASPARVSQKARRSESRRRARRAPHPGPRPGAHPDRHHRHRPRVVHPRVSTSAWWPSRRPCCSASSPGRPTRRRWHRSPGRPSCSSPGS